MNTCLRRSFLLTALFSAAVYAAEPPTPKPDPAAVDFQWGVGIPMPDGVHLHAVLYRPRDQRDPLPCVFTLTPYNADTYHERGMYFAANGYVFLTVDVRGRGASGGEFTPVLDDATDGPEIVAWLAKQPYCNGKVAMWGGSYAGQNQWIVARSRPPHLTTIVPAASARPGVDFPMRNNIGSPYVMRWLTLTSGSVANFNLFGDSAFWNVKSREYYMQHRRFSELDRLVGNPSPHFQKWIAHPSLDDYWDGLGATSQQLARIDIPILTITGAYDGDQPGALSWYRDHLQHASRKARTRHFLIMGPWDHAGTRTPKAEVGGLKFGEASLLDLNELHKQWYDWTMKSGSRPEFLKDRVAWYVIGAERWRYAPSLEAVTARHEPYYLHSSGTGSNDVFASGRLAPTRPDEAASDRYVYDPLDTAPGEAEIAHALATAGVSNQLVDQSAVMRNATDSLIYHTAGFEQDTDISGFFRLSVWLTLDQPDTDFKADVYEILPDGSSVKLSGDVLRARYRESLRAERPVPRDEILRYDFEGFSFISRQVKKGSRLRLVFGPINSIYRQKNYNSGGEVAHESADDARTVTVTLHQGPQHPSALYVPIAADK